MITILALIALIAIYAPVIILPPFSEAQEWELYKEEAYNEYAEEFTALFNSYETKWAKNGALMIRQGNSGSYKFAKKG